jgi:valyl-tRNA synthetase
MKELPKAYEPALVEDRLYASWLEKNCFKADASSNKEAYSIVIPPPNITGVLTMGHVLNNTIQDILARKARMEGKEVLWLPGTDHAGLATQTAVEKALRKEEKKTRHDLGREEFLNRVWEWQEKHGGIIIQQLKKLGCSCDWPRLRYTMDDSYARAVQKVFVELYQRGYIYRGLRMVNWCPGSLTAISDEEVIPKKQKGHLWTIKYEIVGQPGRYLEVATVRPETIMGDVAVAVNPHDERYEDLIGEACRRPFPDGEIPIIADELVDAKFGTGALKITPAHSKDDFEIAQRHDLLAVDVLTPNGKINCPAVPELHGMDRFEARKKAIEMLRERGLLTKEEPYENNVGYSERADVPIEPRLSEQWFLKYPKIEEAKRVVRDGLIKFYPKHWEKVYQHWLENIQDWCISRQVWWGHRIPVWYNEGSGAKCQIESPGAGWTQDEDTLDTWFSSWLWAYETMDEATRRKFYPTSALVTGPDIIFLWVARMIIAGLELNPGKSDKLEDNIPFKDVCFTGIIQDKQGKKMSKSLGNSPDPLDLIAKYGADGLRFGLMRIAPQGQDIRFDEKQIEEGRNFCNKLWNACRFRTTQPEVIDPKANPLDPNHKLSIFAECLLTRLKLSTYEINSEVGYQDFQFSNIAFELYRLVWGIFCSQFLEVAKYDFQTPSSPTRSGTLATIDFALNRILRLLHPFTPFVTEELWLNLGFGNETIQLEPWPTLKNDAVGKMDLSIERDQFAVAIYNSVDAGRQLRGELQIPSNQKAKFHLATAKRLPDYELAILGLLLGASDLTQDSENKKNGRFTHTPCGDLFILIEVDPALEKQRLEKELAKMRKDLELTDKKLNDSNMLAKAPAEKVTQWRELAKELAGKEAKLKKQLNSLK